MQAALHPTPAVCGRPRATAKEILASEEPFDRGFYSGPFGWLSGSAAEFVVAIRSALIHPGQPVLSTTQLADNMAPNASDNGNGFAPHTSASPFGEEAGYTAGVQSRDSRSSVGVPGTISLFAGVGIVKGSNPEAEWQVHLTILSLTIQACAKASQKRVLFCTLIA